MPAALDRLLTQHSFHHTVLILLPKTDSEILSRAIRTAETLLLLDSARGLNIKIDYRVVWLQNKVQSQAAFWIPGHARIRKSKGRNGWTSSMLAVHSYHNIHNLVSDTLQRPRDHEIGHVS